MLLVKEEFDVLKTIEMNIGHPIPLVQDITTNPFGFVEHSGHVIRLGLNNQNIRSLTDKIWQLKALKELILTNNKLNLLPYAIGQLEYLETLDAGEIIY